MGVLLYIWFLVLVFVCFDTWVYHHPSHRVIMGMEGYRGYRSGATTDSSILLFHGSYAFNAGVGLCFRFWLLVLFVLRFVFCCRLYFASSYQWYFGYDSRRGFRRRSFRV
ncbi:hypothetical protein EX30DRAFT_116864 [Ascodesmis nigricans]|uniref:Uncharacterized protein n=1 Tax=Ascodesmis nigricans TaxID=341454 RepID=A0A4S2MRZ5_9PEZI|nr:hypothetical protein EX30DRAFT_116864 [Ascodesmis nigricans]